MQAASLEVGEGVSFYRRGLTSGLAMQTLGTDVPAGMDDQVTLALSTIHCKLPTSGLNQCEEDADTASVRSLQKTPSPGCTIAYS